MSNVSFVPAAISPILCIRIWIRPVSEILRLVNVLGFSVSLIILRKFKDKSSNLDSLNPDIEDTAENKSDIAVIVVLSSLLYTGMSFKVFNNLTNSSAFKDLIFLSKFSSFNFEK